MQVQALLALLFTVIVWGVGPVFIRSPLGGPGAIRPLVIRYTIVAIIYAIGLADPRRLAHRARGLAAPDADLAPSA